MTWTQPSPLKSWAGQAKFWSVPVYPNKNRVIPHQGKELIKNTLLIKSHHVFELKKSIFFLHFFAIHVLANFPKASHAYCLIITRLSLRKRRGEIFRDLWVIKDLDSLIHVRWTSCFTPTNQPNHWALSCMPYVKGEV